MFIRELKPEDAELFQKSRLEALQNSPTAFGASYEDEVNLPTSFYSDRIKISTSIYFAAFENDRIVGTVCLITNERVKTRHRATVVSVYVYPECRGQGVGKMLMSAVIEKAKEMGFIEQIELTVVTSEEPALALYKKMGFEIYATEPHSLKYNEKYYDEHFMIKNI